MTATATSGVFGPPRDTADLAAVKALFLEYAQSLDFDLCFQDFEAEMAAFPGQYAPPGGALLLARLDGAAVGAVGLRDLGEGICEMKRLYLRPAARGSGLGPALVDGIIAEGRRLGYRRMRLDTVPGPHDAAIALYRRLGFAEIPPYCLNPVPGAIYMELAFPVDPA
ncbi:MAG: GNAT family N-acetyltransferase [Alphaproteobacteria bacterium]|jgi:GNAT superfamily N-acetyltransferase|nr:GNAT family N-acetyltransferase [Alphaproteobacteria bacterium]MDP6564906.1 GNAT family N-acetyltransferase [Alphaproteobacteria bacterium]MDP6815355.1 GNAT family N-acetyltransferase [Alphaproteobacteria bacterium]